MNNTIQLDEFVEAPLNTDIEQYDQHSKMFSYSLRGLLHIGIDPTILKLYIDEVANGNA
jgi:hypothetical protein